MEIYEEEIQILLSDLELMMAIETDPEKNQLRARLIGRLKRQVNAPESPQYPLFGAND